MAVRECNSILNVSKKVTNDNAFGIKKPPTWKAGGQVVYHRQVSKPRGLDLQLGKMTWSITWITPLLAITSAKATVAPSIMTMPLVVRMLTL